MTTLKQLVAHSILHSLINKLARPTLQLTPCQVKKLTTQSLNLYIMINKAETVSLNCM